MDEIKALPAEVRRTAYEAGKTLREHRTQQKQAALDQSRQGNKADKVGRVLWMGQQATKNTAEDGGVKYSQRSFAEQVDEVLAGTFDRTNAVYLGGTPKILSDIGLDGNLPMLTTAKHLKNANRPKNAKKHQHGLSDTQLKNLPNAIANPVMILDSMGTTPNTVVVVTDMLDQDKMPVIVAIQADGKGMYNNVEIDTNFVLSYYGRSGFGEYLKRHLSAGNLLYYNKQKSDTLSNRANVQFVGQLKGYRSDTILRKTKANVNRNKKHSFRSKLTGSQEIQSFREHLQQNGTQLTEVQEASIFGMERLTALMGVDMYVFESYLNDDGERVYLDEHGREVPAPNGYYENGDVYIDLNAGQRGEGTMLFTVAHELTHFIQEWSPAKYDVLCEVIMDGYARAGISVDQLIREQIIKAKENGRTLSYEEAFDEVIADSMESMLADGRVIEMMAQLKQRDKSLWEKIRDFFTELLEDLKAMVNAYKHHKPNSKEGRMVADMQEVIDKIQPIFAEALLDAGETRQTATKNTAEDGGVQYQIREIGNSGKFYVQADRQVMSGDNPEQWGKQIAKYINEEIRNGQDIAIPTSDGHILLLTGRSSYKLTDRHTASIYNQVKVLMSDEAYALKGRAASHIDELIRVAKFDGYSTDVDGKHENDIGEDGFNYFEAYFMDFDGQYYCVSFSAGLNENEETVYSIGKIRQRRFSAGLGSSSNQEALENGRKPSGNSIRRSVDESQGKTVVQLAFEKAQAEKEAREKRKNSFRSARDVDGVPMAEQMERDGKSRNEIWYELGLIRDAAGNWVTEIDDSGAEFYASGDARLRNNPDWIRFKELEGKMIDRTITEAEHQELKELSRVVRVLRRGTTLQDYLKHDELYRAAPYLKDIPFRMDVLSGDVLGRYSSSGIAIDNGQSADDRLSETLHEVQHAMQDYEDRPRGASPEYWQKRLYNGEIIRKNDRRIAAARDRRDAAWDKMPEALKAKVREINRESIAAKESGNYDRLSELQEAMFNSADADLYAEYDNALWEERLYAEYNEPLSARNLYYRTAGEIEASLVQQRRNMSAEQRRTRMPDFQWDDAVFAETKNTAGGGVRYSLRSVFSDEVDAWLKEKTPAKRATDGGWFEIGTTSDALKSIGVKDSKIYWRKYKIAYIMEDHPKMDIDIIKQVPEIIENPVIVMKSKTVENSIVVFGDVVTKDGQKVMAALELTPKKTGKMEADFVLLSSAYSRDNANVKNLIETSEVLYLDDNKKRTDTWLKSLRVQFPSGQLMYGSIGSISYADGAVNITGVPFSQLGVINKTNNGNKRNSDRSRKTAATLERENKRLKQDVKYLRELVRLQKKVTDGTKMKRSDVEAMAKLLMKNNSVKGDYRELAPMLTELYEFMAVQDNPDMKAIREKAQPAVDWLLLRTYR